MSLLVDSFKRTQAMEIKASKGGLFTLKFMFTSWPNSVKLIFAKLLLLMLSPVYISLILVVFLITLLGYAINWIPLVSSIFAIILLVCWYICVFFAMIINVYDSDNYVDGLHKYTDDKE